MTNFSVKSDHDLFEYLSNCDAFELHTIISAMKSKFSKTSNILIAQYPCDTDLPCANTTERKELSKKIVRLFHWYGSNAIKYGIKKLFVKKDGCHYHEILRDTAKILNKSQKKKDRKELPKVASADEWEDLICSLLLASAVKKKTPEQIAIMFQEAGLEAEAAKFAAKQFSPGCIVGISIPIAVKILGKKTVTILLGKILIQLTYKRIGKKAAIEMAKRLLIKLPQKTFAKIISGIGWILLATDTIFFLSSPARRITVPTISMISALRSLKRLEKDE